MMLVVKYPKPDYVGSLKMFAGMAVFLLGLHWTPDIAGWIHSNFFGEKLIVDVRSFQTVLTAAHVMVGIATAINLAGLLWATWHHYWRKP